MVLTGAQPIWCGDFGCDPETLLPRLSSPQAGRVWKSACTSVLGNSPWTSVSTGKAVDLVLHEDGLETLAVLGGLGERSGLVEWFKNGYPSDHLLQLAAFVGASAPP